MDNTIVPDNSCITDVFSIHLVSARVIIIPSELIMSGLAVILTLLTPVI